ncbi:MAG: LPS export ABC transporter periplasmic protein LptC [Chitinophagaceae bacterium]|nr:LPS export ABC transporter periplasmic protein LptC [Chitinophagaceae bacterium]
MNIFIRIVLSVIFFCIAHIVTAQQKPPVPGAPGVPPPKDSTREIHLIRSDVLRLEKKDDSTEFQILVGNARLRQGNTYFKGDSIVMNKQKNIIEVFGNIHINDADSVNVYSQYLIYYGNPKLANLKKAVKLTDGKATLTTEDLEYDLNTKTGSYLNNGKIVTNSSTLTSKEGYYYADTRDAYFKTGVKLIDPEYTMATDTLLYNVDSKMATFVSPTTINDGKSIIRTSDGYYDMDKGQANFGQRPVIQDSTQRITAETIFFDKKTGDGSAKGNFVYADTAQGVTVMAEEGIFNRDKKTFMATVKPVMIIKQDNDSLFITGDILYSGIKSDTLYKKDSTAEALADAGPSTPNAGILKTGDKLPENMLPGKRSLPGAKRKNVDAADSSGNIAKLPQSLEKDSAAALLSSPPAVTDSLQVTLTADSLLNIPGRDSIAIAKREELKPDTITQMKPPEIEKIDSVRFFRAYHHVKIFSDSMQAVCDSMYFSGIDSIFRLFTDPVVWAKESQITGDTIFLHTKNKKPQRVEVWENAFSISKSNDEYFNQLKGNVINGYFVEGDIEHIRAKGSAESLYYLQDDDSAYTGANYAQADLINLYLAKRELQKITWINEVTGGFYPVREVPEEKKRFRNFKWQETRRPKTRLELFE